MMMMMRLSKLLPSSKCLNLLMSFTHSLYKKHRTKARWRELLWSSARLYVCLSACLSVRPYVLVLKIFYQWLLNFVMMFYQISCQYDINPMNIVQTKPLCYNTLKLSVFLEMTFCTYRRLVQQLSVNFTYLLLRRD